MIRMGRSGSTREQTNDTQSYQEQQQQQQQQQQPPTNSNNYYQNYSGVSQPEPLRAASDSESMARDIKEGRLSGYVGNGTVLTGETSFQAMLRIDGHLTGKIASESGTLIVGSTGRVDANITVAQAIISGTVNGDIYATEKLELTRTAKVIGNVQSPRLVIDDGAIFEGGCTMLKAKEAADKRASVATTEYPKYEPAAEADSTEITEESEDSTVVS